MKPFIKPYLHLVFFLLAPFFCLASQLDIHHIGVGQGDATLFVFTYDDGTTVNILIDTGNSSTKGVEVFQYLVDHIPVQQNRNIHVLITSHLHSDHYGGTPTLLQLLGDNNWGVLRIIDRSGGIAPDPTVPCYTTDGIVVSNDPVAPEYAEPNSGLYDRYINACNAYFPGARQNVAVGTELFRDVLNISDRTFKFWSLANNACVLDTYGTKSATCYIPNNENDLSSAWLVQYQGFKYFSGGDIGGGAPYLDLEEDLCGAFLTWPDFATFHFCSFKVSHHGSAHSTNTEFVSCANPTLAIIPSALRSFSGKQIPTEGTLSRLDKNFTSLFYTFIKNDNIYYSGSVSQYNHVLMTISNPGYGQNIGMQIQQATVNKSTLATETPWGSGIITCTKNHDAPTSTALVAHSNLDGFLHSDSHTDTTPGASGEMVLTQDSEALKKAQIFEKLAKKEKQKYKRLMRCKLKKRQRLKRKLSRRAEKLKKQSAR